MIACFILLSVGLSAAHPIGFELLKDHLFKKNKPAPVYVTGHQYYQQAAAPDLAYGPPELPGTNPQVGAGGAGVAVGGTVGIQYPTWQWPQKQIFQKPISVYQPVVQVKPFHIPKPQFVPVVKPFPIYKPEFVHVPINKPSFEDIKSGFVSKIEGIKSDIASKISGIKSGIQSGVSDKITGVKNFATGIKSEIGSKVSGIQADLSGKVTALNDRVTGIKSDIYSGISDKVTGVHQTVSGIKSDISDKVTGINSAIYSGISDKVTGVKQTVDGFKAAVADGITDKVIGLKVIGAHIGDEVKEIGTAVDSALKIVKNDFFNKKHHHHQPQYVLVPARPISQGPTYTYVQPPPQVSGPVNPPSLTYGPPELH